MFAFASFTWCGISACTAPDRGSLPEVVTYLLVAGAAVAVPISLIPWTGRRAVRAGIGVTLGVATTVVGWVIIGGL